MLSVIIALVIVILFGVTGYVLFPLLLSAKMSSSESEEIDSSDKDISVLIPCHNEGEEIVAVIESLLKQKYLGTLFIYILVKSESDTSYQYVTKLIQENKTRHQINVVSTGFSAKKDKLNAIIPKIHTDYTFLIDADHIADPAVVSSSVSYLDTHMVVAVQGVRRAKSTKGFFQLLDSLQNHVGNEMMNHLIRYYHGSSFFTGTTALFKTDILKEYGFSNSITEDTYLSYQLILAGHRIGYISHLGSSESVSPRLVDYIARRRRWSAGHNRIAFNFFKNIFLSQNIDTKQRLIMLLHSLVFIVPVLSVVPLIAINTFVFLQLTSSLQMYIVVSSILIVFLVSLIMERKASLVAIGTIFGTFISFPLTIIGFLSVMFLQGSDIYYSLISFPYLQDWLGVIVAIAFVLPLLFAIRSNYFFQSFSKKQMLVIILSYPFMVIVDMYTFLLGFGDALLKRFNWKPISRNTVKQFPYRKIGILFLILGIVVYGYISHIFSPNSCKNPWLSYFSHNAIDFDIQKNIEGDQIVVDIEVTANTEQEMIILHINDIEETHPLVNGSTAITKKFPLGFEEYAISISIPETSCRVSTEFNTRHIETRNGTIYLNGEPFLVKGIVGAYTQRSVGLSHQEGMQLITSLGANAIRIYHAPNKQFLKALDEHMMFAMIQPARSNWKSTDIWLRGSLGLLNRYDRLQEKYGSNPHILSISLGNEIEIHSVDRINTIFQMLDDINDAEYEQLSSYASFYPSINYPSSVLGVNMLDTGETYWEKSLDILQSFEKPVIATELGGFEAFYEKTDPVLRAIRLKEQWMNIINRGFSGAFIFQSHDNWAQPVPEGYNNPFVLDQPDDARGIFNNRNEQKSLAHVVENMFNDIDVSYILSDDDLLLQLRNIREYALYDVQISNGISLGNLLPESIQEVRIPNESLSSEKLILSYQTHRGIPGQQEISLPSFSEPFFPNDEQFLPLTESSTNIDIIPLEDSVDVFLPSSWELLDYDIQDGRVEGVGSISQMELIDGTLPKGDEQGMYQMTLTSSESLKGKQLLLEGTGSSTVQLHLANRVIEVSVHPYREQLIDIRPYVFDDVYEIGISFQREHTVYLPEELNPDGETIYIDMQMPKLFEPKVLNFVKK